ncbi:hypothetical protein SELMODRAFT_424830 [Selaginella moellendorffii]|uniref:Uncharacterized protein n=1 Tax=Selaginella moellendorffii TaxID=88036 RepID=D8SR55_SELML|nr:hypothetical protein SELMODRAFT_424830 [Selaginella moellendorffii]
MEAVKKRNFTVEGFQWPFSRVAMDWRPGAGTAKLKKISRDINVATPPPPLLSHRSSLVSLRQLNHSPPPPPPHDPNFLSNALRTMSGARLEEGSWWGWNCGTSRSREKLKLLNEIEALINSEENGLNMEGSAKAAEGRLRSLLDICVCSQCQENIENRIALQNMRNKALEDGKVLSAETNVATAKQDDQTAPALEGPKTTTLPETMKRDFRKQESLEKEGEKERRLFLANVKEAMKRDRKLGKYLSFLDNSQNDGLQKDDLCDKHDQDSEALEDPVKVRKDQTPGHKREAIPDVYDAHESWPIGGQASGLEEALSDVTSWNTIKAYPGMIIVEALETFWSSCPTVHVLLLGGHCGNCGFLSSTTNYWKGRVPWKLVNEFNITVDSNSQVKDFKFMMEDCEVIKTLIVIFDHDIILDSP